MTHLLALSLLAACGTETGNPELDVQLRLTGTSTSGKVAVAAPPPVQVQGAWVVVDDVRLVDGATCDTPTEVEYTAEGPFETDLLSETPGVIHIPAAATDYCRLRVRLDKADGVVDAPGALDDHSVLVTGRLDDDQTFQVRSRRSFEVDLRSRGASFPVEAGADQLVLAFDLGAWIGALDFDDADEEDGVVYVDEDHNEDLLELFEAQIEAVLGLHDDADGDGDLDDEDELLAD